MAPVEMDVVNVIEPEYVGESGQPRAAVLVDEVELARAQEYALLATLLTKPPDTELLDKLANLNGDQTPLGCAHQAVADAAGRMSAADVEREYFTLFVGIGRGDLVPYGSFYLAGFLHERPLARLRTELKTLGIERSEATAESEDHAAILCEIMACLIRGDIAASAEAERHFFERHVVSWMPRFFEDLANSQAASFYRRIGSLGQVFMEIERKALNLSG
jgi:TorA maturation chaperone TorD